MKTEFLAAFQISKTVIFEVDYYTLSTNRTPHFATLTYKFNQSKTDYKQCGQAQKILLPFGLARNFWQKWDCKHLEVLTEEEYKAMMIDMEKLFKIYNRSFF